MGIFDIFRANCVICNRKKKPLRTYVNDDGKEIKVCVPCSEYAERRAYKVKK